ncbi:MAG: EamA family transporter [Pseudomonadota bacterium]|nr:EamA family transporter [Pseudomonadota bacterium]
MKDLPIAVQGAFWMSVSAVCYVGSAVLIRFIGETYSPFLLTFFRSVIAVIILAPMIFRVRVSSLWPERPVLVLMTGIFSYIGIFLWFYAAGRMPVAEFFALQFATPLFTIAFAIIFLRERSDFPSWLATFVGFTGVLIVLRPGIIEVSVAAVAAVSCAASYASVNTLIKSLSKAVPTTVIVFYANFLLVPISLPMAIKDWQLPNLVDWPTIIGAAVLSTIGYVTVSKGIAMAAARVVQPVNFLRMPVGAAFGWVLFNEFPDIWTWIGAIVIFCATTYTVHRGTQNNKERR